MHIKQASKKNKKKKKKLWHCVDYQIFNIVHKDFQLLHCFKSRCFCKRITILQILTNNQTMNAFVTVIVVQLEHTLSSGFSDGEVGASSTSVETRA